MSIRKRITGFALATAILFGSFPIYTSTVHAVTRPRKEDDVDYNPTFSFASNNQAYYDAIKAETDTIEEIGELPKLDDFKLLSGYNNEGTITLTKFRELYGTGADFNAPNDTIRICLTSADEFLLFGSLVNNTAEDETPAERIYYATARYELSTSITLPSTLTTYQPIGTATYPFGGTFDGREFEIKGVQMNGVAVDTYTIGYFGLFGVTSSTAVIKQLGITGCIINLPYVVAADVGILVAKNGGLIEDCYINNRQTCKVAVSNSTAGGICAENYGTIRRCYAEAFIDVDVDAGSYSEPQPIATVNHTGGTVDVNSCYYCAYTDSSYPINSYSTIMYMDKGTSPCIYGWKYLGDRSQILGTELHWMDFIAGHMPNTNFKRGDFEFSAYSSSYTEGSGKFRLSYLPALVGNGANFNLEMANYIKSQQDFVIVDEDDWKLLVHKSNKRGDTTAEEQSFYSKLTVRIYGKATDGSYTWGTSFQHILDISASIEPLGTDEYPFCGTVSYYNSDKDIIRFHLGNGEQSPLFGTLGSGFYMSNVIIQTDGYLDPAKFIDNGYRGIIANKILSGAGFHISAKDTTNYGGGSVSGHLYIDMDSAYYTQHESELKSYTWDELGVVGTTSGNMNNNYLAMGYEILNDIDDSVVFTNYFISNYGKVVLNNSTAKRVTGDTSSKFTKSHNSTQSYLLGNDVTVSAYSVSAYWRPSGIKVLKFLSYPCLMRPEEDENGVLLVSKPSNFLWLISYAVGQRAKLTRTIDLSNMFLSGTDRKGYYTLDGERPSTDTTDISNFITVNANNSQKDCYAIIGLTLTNGVLSQGSYNMSGKTVDWANIYLIGGTFINNTASSKYNYVLCSNMTNVHNSMDITISNYSGGYYSSSSSSTYYFFAMCRNADYCSNNNDVYYYATRTEYFCCLGLINNNCYTYNKFKYAASNARCQYANLGVEANYCVTKASSECTAVTSSAELCGLGVNNKYCRADGVYDFRNVADYAVFGENMDYCVFEGEFDNDIAGTNNSCLGTKRASNSYITDDALFKGDFSGLSKGYYTGYSNLIKGRFFLPLTSSNSKLGSSIQYTTVLADIYLVAYDEKISANTDAGTLALGITDKLPTASITLITGDRNKFNGSISFIREDLSPIEHMYWGGSFGLAYGTYFTNYFNFDLGSFGYMQSFIINSAEHCINYGYVKANTATALGVLFVMKNGVNFGDIQLCNPMGYSPTWSIVDAYYDGRNYGHVDVTFSTDSLYSSRFLLNIGGDLGDSHKYSSCNYGDVRLIGINDVSLKSVEVNVIMSSAANYGNFECCNLKQIPLTVQNGLCNYGSYDIHDNAFKSCYIYQSYAYLMDQSCTFIDNSSIDIYDCTFTANNLRIVAYAYPRYGTPALQTYRQDTDINIHDCTFTNTNNYNQGIIIDTALSYEKPYDMKVNMDINIDNIQGKPYIFIQPLQSYFGCRNSSYSNQLDWYLDGNISITNSDLSYFTIMASERGDYSKGVLYNNQNVFIENVAITNESNVYGIYQSKSGRILGSAIHSGDIHIDTTGAGAVYVTGIAGTGATNYVSNNNILWQSGDIYVKHTGTIGIYGIAKNTATSTTLYNAVNSGNTVIDTYSTTKVYYNGISHNISKVSGVINYGHLTVHGTGTVESVVWIGTNISELHSAVNYGTTNVSSPNVGGFATFTNNAKVSYCMNFGDIVGANIYDNSAYANVDTAYLVDISGNKGVYPNRPYVYSTDNTITDLNHTASVAYNTFGEAVEGLDPQTSLTTTIQRNITYDDVIKPEFGIRYNNPLATEYLTASTKQEYNGDNGLEYAEFDNLRGKLRATVNSLNGAGGFVVTAFNKNGENIIGLPLEHLILQHVDFEDEYWGTTKTNNVYLKDKFSDVVLQVEDNSWVEINDFTLKSSVKYETKDGSMEYITTRSSLIPFQASIDANNDGVYHDKVIVTVADVYMVTNAFKDVTSEPVVWEPTIESSSGATIRYLEEPIISDTASEFLDSIKTYVGAEDSVITVGNTSNTIELQLEDIGKIRYAIVGVLTSADGTHQNVIALKLHSAGNIPLGYITSFVYPMSIQNSGDRYVYSDAFGNGVTYYSESNRFTPSVNDGFTVDVGVQHTETWGDLEYPIYNMTTNIVHTSDGLFKSSGWYGPSSSLSSFNQVLDYSYSRIFTLDYKMQNVVKTKISIIDSANNEYVFEENAPADGVATKDGINVIKNGDTQAGSDTYTRVSDGVSLSTYYESNNPFYKGGDKQIVCKGYTENNDEVVLFKINVHKTSSFENYFKYYAEGFRKDLLNENGTTTIVYNASDLSPSNFVGIGNEKNTTISTLARRELLSISYGDRIVHGDTNYPSTVTREYKVTAEDGSVSYYTHITKLPDIVTADIGISGLFGGDASGKLNYTTNGIITLPSQYNTFSALFGLDDAFYSDEIQGVWGITSPTKAAYNFLKCEKYVNGEYVGDLQCNRDNLLYYGYNHSENEVYDPETGMGFYTSSGWNSGIVFRKDSTISREDFPDDVITYRNVLDYKLEDGTYATIQLRDVTYQKTLKSDRQLISSTATNKIMTTAISTIENDFDNLLDIDANGVIDYTNQPADNTKLYLLDVYEPNVVSSQISYKISNTATLQKYNESNSTWTTVFNAGVNNDTYTYTQTFTPTQLGAGVTNKFRILAQDYTTNDAEKATHVYYFDHTFTAATRNKDVQILFKTDDETTMQLYNEIIANQGSLAIQIKNMNGTQATLQQTKMYYNNSNMESTYYKLSQGDFAVDVQVPEGYTPKVRIIGVSTEGWLQDNPVVKGKRIRLPYPNAQTYRLEVYLERNESYPYWGIEHYQSFYKGEIINHI